MIRQTRPDRDSEVRTEQNWNTQHVGKCSYTQYYHKYSLFLIPPTVSECFLDMTRSEYPTPCAPYKYSDVE